MKRLVVTILFLVGSVPPVSAAGLVTPTLSPPLATARFFDPDRVLTTAGVKYFASSDLTLEPELGLGYRASERDFAGGVEESIHRVHAQAGWRLSLANTLYLSAAAKLPLLTIQSAESSTGQDLGTRRDYDFTRTFRNTPTWTGELGFHVTSGTDFTLYYDQTPLSGWFAGGPQQEDRVGTRLIFKFK